MYVKLLCFLFILRYSNSARILTLNGEWILQDDKHNITNIKAKVPGGVYSDLMNSGIIGDIFYGYNDINTKWVPRLNWTYYRNFLITDTFLNYDNINIVFEGLDTFSYIFINDKLVGSSDNMFVQYIFDIKKYIKTGRNKIEVRFLSPIEIAAKLSAIQTKNYTVPPTCPPTEYNGECHVNMIRKMQASFAWDWGPSFPSVGIWKNVYIESYNESIIRYIVSDVTEEDEDHWKVNLDIYLANNIKNSVKGRIQFKFYLNFINITSILDVDTKGDKNNEIVVKTNIEIRKNYVNTWWPNGYGPSDLYSLKVVYMSEDNSEKSIRHILVGFRTIELIQTPLDSGLTFYFKVNRIPIFMKGTNEIPIDILPERGQNKTKIKNLLKAAKDSHMNMIRVWGGGVYESDYFYDLADEYGILIWQDFMFACAMYPVTDSYLQSVISEVRHQVRRIYGHTSVALFSGNNENEGALIQNWYNTFAKYKTYYNDYIKLYVKTIKTEYLQLTNNRGIFITSSPTNGEESDKEGYVAKNPGDSLYGDVHFYNYVLDPFNSNYYPVPRFASEYGYQSLPSKQSFLTVTKNVSDLNINSIFMNHRQHHLIGNLELQLLIKFYFQLPNETSKNYDEAFIYYSQIVQALAVKIETEHYRRYKSFVNDKGEGYTSGVLYWQLNDVWVAPSWSGIDHLGKWKMLQYYTQEFFAPVIITGHINLQRTLEIYLVSDLLSPLFNLTVSVEVYRWNSFKPVYAEKILIKELEASVLVESIETDDYLTRIGCGYLPKAKQNCFFYLSVEKNGVKVTPDNFVFPAAIKDSNLTGAEVKISSVKNIDSDDSIFDVELISDNIAIFVWLESDAVEGRFSENGFILNEPSRNVYFFASQKTTKDVLMKTLTVTHLLDGKFF